jgi:hypothetical protein
MQPKGSFYRVFAMPIRVLLSLADRRLKHTGGINVRTSVIFTKSFMRGIAVYYASSCAARYKSHTDAALRNIIGIAKRDLAGYGKKTSCAPMDMWAFRTLGKDGCFP